MMQQIETELGARINRANKIANSPGASNRTRIKFRHSAAELSNFLGWLRANCMDDCK